MTTVCWIQLSPLKGKLNSSIPLKWHTWPGPNRAMEKTLNFKLCSCLRVSLDAILARPIYSSWTHSNHSSKAVGHRSSTQQLRCSCWVPKPPGLVPGQRQELSLVLEQRTVACFWMWQPGDCGSYTPGHKLGYTPGNMPQNGVRKWRRGILVDFKGIFDKCVPAGFRYPFLITLRTPHFSILLSSLLPSILSSIPFHSLVLQ